jgi:hypothetical protein
LRTWADQVAVSLPLKPARCLASDIAPGRTRGDDEASRYCQRLFWLVIGLGLSLWSLSAYEIGRLTEPGPAFSPWRSVRSWSPGLTVLAGQWRRKKGPEPVETPTAGAALESGWHDPGHGGGGLLFEALGVLLTFFLLIALLMEGVERKVGNEH